MLQADLIPCQTSVMENFVRNVHKFFHGSVEWNTVLLRISARARIQFVGFLLWFGR